jgi:hypothetical protein
MAQRQCRVTVTDVDGIDHSVMVEGDSVYLAAARGLEELRRNHWVGEIAGGINQIQVEIHEAHKVSHAVSYRKLVDWARRTAGGPAENTRRAAVRAALGIESGAEK